MEGFVIYAFYLILEKHITNVEIKILSVYFTWNLVTGAP